MTPLYDRGKEKKSLLKKIKEWRKDSVVFVRLKNRTKVRKS